jgi:hypothetical protein
MAKIRITESQLRQIVEESVNSIINESYINENEIEEGVWDNIKSGFKGAFGADAQRAGGAIKGAVNNVKNAAQRFGQGVQNTYNNAVQGVQNGYENVKKGVGQRVDAFKANYQAGQNADKINGVISTLEELQASGVISGPKTNATIAELKKCLDMGIKGMNGRAQKVVNKIGK